MGSKPTSMHAWHAMLEFLQREAEESNEEWISFLIRTAREEVQRTISGRPAMATEPAEANAGARRKPERLN